jgi:very-short-patch-repair endonuclease
MIELYESGIGFTEISDKFGCSKNVIKRRLIDNGVHIRSRSEVVQTIWKTRWNSPAEKEKMLSAAWDASRGRTDSIDTKIARAKTIEQKLIGRGRFEEPVAKLFENKGFEVVRQMAVNIYNIDIAIPTHRIAVEVFGGNWHSLHNAKERQHVKYLLDNNWFVFIIRINREVFDEISIANQFSTIVDVFGGYESLRGKYGVIRGNGKPSAKSCDDVDDWTRVI